MSRQGPVPALNPELSAQFSLSPKCNPDPPPVASSIPKAPLDGCSLLNAHPQCGLSGGATVVSRQLEPMRVTSAVLTAGILQAAPARAASNLL
jgi:hypothetical protein